MGSKSAFVYEPITTGKATGGATLDSEEWKGTGDSNFGVFFLNNQPDSPIIQIYSVIKLYMFRGSSLPIIRSFLLRSILTLHGSGHQKHV
jgi:hypothetical protein